MSRSIFTFTLVFLLSGCGYYHITKQKPGGGGVQKPQGGWSFEKIKAAVLQDNCITCHSEAKATATKPALETYAQVFALRQEIADDVRSGNMPDDGPMPPEEMRILLAWLDAGAPEFSDLPIPTLSFEEVKTRLFQPLCMECHKNYGTYEKVIKVIDEIQLAIENNDMPKDRAPVSDELKALLKQWIAEGKPQNKEI